MNTYQFAFSYKGITYYGLSSADDLDMARGKALARLKKDVGKEAILVSIKKISGKSENPRPPKGWFNDMAPRLRLEYKGRSEEDIDKIAAGIWYSFPLKTRNRLIRRYDNA